MYTHERTRYSPCTLFAIMRSLHRPGSRRSSNKESKDKQSYMGGRTNTPRHESHSVYSRLSPTRLSLSHTHTAYRSHTHARVRVRAHTYTQTEVWLTKESAREGVVTNEGPTIPPFPLHGLSTITLAQQAP